MAKNFLLFLFPLFLTFQAKAKVEVYFSPSTACEDRIIEAINQTEHSLDIVMYSLTNQKIVDSVIAAHKRGVKIRILTDRLQAAGRYALVTDLYRQGLNVRVDTVHKIQHNKTAIFDGTSFITGSYNWTDAATKYNSENCSFVSEELNAVETMKQRMEYLWQINSPEKSEAWFQKRI